jgi:hypothetical protein
MNKDDYLPNETVTVDDMKRRDMLKQAAFGAITVPALFSLPQEARAGEVGARITKAVTTSELGISVRRAVVQGVQVADSIDAQWEQFSDRFSIWVQHEITMHPITNKLPFFFAKDDLPNPQHHQPPLDVNVASKLLEISNQAFLSRLD